MSRHLTLFTDIHWTLIGFVIFVVLFLFFIVSTYFPSQIELMKYLEKLPLEEVKEGDSHGPK